jgi:16S rRNA (adenine1518-N6/adenine1519-N6)-dimethyltransferase
MKRQRLGQHYLVNGEVIRRMVQCAEIGPSDRVLEIGTGKGSLTRELVGLGASFTGYEIDEANYRATLEAVRTGNARIVLADAFSQNPMFDVLVTSLPYSQSATFVRWLSIRRFSRAVAILQRDFVEKIAAPPGDRDYRGISAVAQIAFDVKVLDRVDRNSFDPPPRVDSAMVSLTPKRVITRGEADSVIRLFSLRRRRVDSAVKKLGFDPKGDHGGMRVLSLTPEEVHQICRPRGRQ